MKTTLAILAFAFSLSGSAFAAEVEEPPTLDAKPPADAKVVKINTLMYPGAPMAYYNGIDLLLHSAEANAVCPNGIKAVHKFMTEVNGLFIVKPDNSNHAGSYPKIRLVALVSCS